jgi:predicted esterase
MGHSKKPSEANAGDQAVSVLPDPLKRNVSVNLPITYLHINQGVGKPLLVFFHGYTDTAAAFVRRAFPSLDDRFEILAPNGLFPTPLKEKLEWKQAFAWYFVDFAKKMTMIPPQVSANAVSNLIEELGLQDRKKVLLGFSQGGFFLPYVLPKLSNVIKMFSIGAAYRPEDYAASLSVDLDALHGDRDLVISLERSRSSFESLKDKNPSGVFRAFEDMGHTMNDEARHYLRKKLEELFP